MKDIIQDNKNPKRKEEDELDKDLAKQLEWIQLLEELDRASHKRTLNKIEEISVSTFAT